MKKKKKSPTQKLREADARYDPNKKKNDLIKAHDSLVECESKLKVCYDPVPGKLYVFAGLRSIHLVVDSAYVYAVVPWGEPNRVIGEIYDGEIVCYLECCNIYYYKILFGEIVGLIYKSDTIFYEVDE